MRDILIGLSGLVAGCITFMIARSYTIGIETVEKVSCITDTVKFGPERPCLPEYEMEIVYNPVAVAITIIGFLVMVGVPFAFWFAIPLIRRFWR